MFGAAGTAGAASLDQAWAESIVTGKAVATPLPTKAPDIDLLERVVDELDKPLATSPESLAAAIVSAARSIDKDASDDVRTALETATATAAEMLDFSLQSAEGTSRKPKSYKDIGTQLFGGDHWSAVRGLMALRAIPDLPDEVIARADKPRREAIESLPSFRMHCFVRNVEGLFSSLTLGEDGKPLWGKPSIERGQDYDIPRSDGSKLRLFEMLYCEACGELYVGGKRGEVNDKVSLLPTPQELEKLPEEASTLRFEDASFTEFALFWPRTDGPQSEQPEKAKYKWNAAFLDPTTGVVTPSAGPGRVPGHLLHRPDGADSHGRDKSDDGTAVPYCCAKCGTDYSWRFRPKNSQRREGRLSPIRTFRTGFGKTSQLLATELAAALKSQGGDGKLVAFSDSREDAANLALDVEVQHQTDLRREILISAAKKIASNSSFSDEQAVELKAVAAAIVDALTDDKTEGVDELLARRAVLQKLANEHKFRPSIALTQLFEFARGRAGFGDEVRPIVAELLSIGATPIKGADTVKNRVRGEPWHRFFTIGDDTVNWKSDAAGTMHDKVDEARKQLEAQQKPEASDLLFNKTYFALEETGLGWPSFFPPVDYSEEKSKLDAWLRLLADAYRVLPNQFVKDANKDWNDANDVLGRARTGRLAVLMGKLFVDPDSSVNEFLSILRGALGHGDQGTVDVTKLYFRMADPADPAWRCQKCGRVHLHRGFGRCTRCGDDLPESTDITSDTVARHNFLGKRVLRSIEGEEPLFRLKCEELTGQTKDQGARLQQFKGVFVRQDGESPGEFASRRKFEEADLLSVTTTMEVGVDIGSLQAVYQGNMPPQRFNYQQRVGRAGRRGQAFSTVLTVCRSKSHDIHYFRNPIDMTGAAPPPPFITTGLIDIPSRLLRKFWLVAAFKWLLDDAVSKGQPWVADRMVPADIHGEFIYTNDYFAADAGWPERLQEALVATTLQYEALSTLLAAGANCDVGRVRQSVTVAGILADIEKLRDEYNLQTVGLASALAERGLFPLYGMPTSSRDLFVEPVRSGRGMEAALEWDSINRDQDMAIFDFAPGSVRTREKLYHRCVGFTGPLPELTAHSTDDLKQPVTPFGNWFRERYSLAYCNDCGIWSRGLYGIPECSQCKADLTGTAHDCATPAAFRTDFKPSQDSLPSRASQRVILASLGKPDETGTVVVGNVRVNFADQSEVYIVNPGSRTDEGFSGFDIKTVTDTRAAFLYNFKDKPFLKMAGQAILVDALEEDPERWHEGADSETSHVWLSSQKITNSLQIGPERVSRRLRVEDLDGGLPGPNSRDPLRTSVRGAAISATELIIQRAALELDIAPEEFDALAPYSRPLPDGLSTPFLQIADSLPNGSGFCRHLLGNSSLPVTTLIKSILDEPSAWPRSILDNDDHTERCGTSCYKCMQRYNNRNYHGLLDWRLGLAYLRAITDPDFLCGLDGNFSGYFELQDWHQSAARFAEHSKTFVPGNETREVAGTMRLPAFSIDESHSRWAVIVHPLWRREGLMAALGLGSEFVSIDTFELSRRPLQAIDRLRTKHVI